MSKYDTPFFTKILEGAVRSAHATVPFVIEWIQPSSVIDVGCGLGAWLSVFRELGVRRILGIDGDYINRNQCSFPPTAFLQPISPTRRLSNNASTSRFPSKSPSISLRNMPTDLSGSDPPGARRYLLCRHPVRVAPIT